VAHQVCALLRVVLGTDRCKLIGLELQSSAAAVLSSNSTTIKRVIQTDLKFAEAPVASGRDLLGLIQLMRL